MWKKIFKRWNQPDAKSKEDTLYEGKGSQLRKCTHFLFCNSHFYHKKPMKQKIIASYFVLLIFVVTLIVAPFYTVTTKIIREKNSQSSMDVFRGMVDLIDNHLEMIANNALSLAMQNEINDFIKQPISDTFTAENIDRINSMQQSLRNLEQTHRYISSVYLYSALSGVVMMSDGGYSQLRDLEDDSWLQMLGEYHAPWSCIRMDNQGNRYLSLLLGIPAFTPMKQGALIVNISEENLSAMIGNEKHRDTGIAILNQDRDIIYLSKAEYTDQLLELLSDIPEEKNGYVSSRGYILSYYISDYTNWKYVNITEERIFMESINRIMWLLFFVLLIVMAVAGVLINRFSGMVYQPIQELVKFFDYLPESRHDTKKDEFDYIVNELKKLNAERQQMQNRLERSADIFQEQFVKNLLAGKTYAEEQLARYFTNTGFQPRGKKYAALIIEIDDMASFSQKNSTVDRSLWLYGIRNIAEELFGRICSVLITEDNERLVGILNSASGRMLEELTDMADELRIKVSELLDISLTVAISQPIDGLDRLGAAYRQACTALRRKFILGMCRTIVYEPGDEQTMTEPGEPFQIQRMINGVKSGGMEIINSDVERFLREIKQERMVDADVLKTNVLLCMKQISAQLGEDNQTEKFVNTDTYRQLSQFETVDQLGHWIIDTLWQMSERISTTDRKKPYYLSKIIECIENHYKEDISLISIADMVGLSASYVSTIINAELNTSLTNYVNQKRIEDAKRLLIKDKNISIDEVREMVGFSNVHTFIRIFKKFEGVTPGKFREMNL